MKINGLSSKYSTCWFLGGTCATSNWRPKLIALLNDNVDFFNPQLGPGEWNEAAQREEDACKAVAKQVYVLSPESVSPYSGFELAVAAVTNPGNVVFAYVGDFPNDMRKSIQKIAKDLQHMGVNVYDNLHDLAEHMNKG